MSIFQADGSNAVAAQMARLGVVAMRIISINFVFAAVGITLSNVFQAVGKGFYSMVISILRQLLVLLPSALLLKAVFNDVNAVWWSFTIAEAFSLVISLLFYRKLRREVLEKL